MRTNLFFFIMVSLCLSSSIFFLAVNADGITNGYYVSVIGSSTSYSDSLQESYDNAGNGDIIQAQAVHFIENLQFDMYKSVTLQGGFDPTFSLVTGLTTLDGNITISNGSLIIKNLAIGLTDRDGDGVVDGEDAFPDDPNEWIDSDNDGIGNNADPNDDNDGVPDLTDTFPQDPFEWIDSDLDGVGDNTDQLNLPELLSVSSYDDYGQARGTLKDGNIIYIANGTAGLTIVQIGYNGLLTKIGSYPLVNGGRARSLVKINQYLYMACRSEGLIALDVSDPASPQHVYTYDTPDQATFLTLHGTTLYLSDRNNLQIFNVSNPQSPLWLSQLQAVTEFEHVVVADGIAYIAGYYSGLFTVDVLDPVNPSIIQRASGVGALWAVEKFGNYVFTGGEGSGLRVFDVTDPYNPFLVTSLDLPSSSDLPTTMDQPPFHMKVLGSYLFIADGDHGIQVVNISNPEIPVIETGSAFDTPGYAFDFYVDGYTMIIGDYNNGVSMINLGSNLDHDGDGIPNYLDAYPLIP